ncbi:EboA domain-containing protein [Streptomyces sp. WMMC500]|uniref:EboA domain-containing protein n=1 Tax=Streptomyces sp. WMMC500 TaxID=3015154 RepID=UPI00248B09C0|nr:EboA domain-containing protein [Streptomyces sp. WMMC500]WBB62072.1 EboA domain-containing protein [Streptomyces sp. WMMC500]
MVTPDPAAPASAASSAASAASASSATVAALRASVDAGLAPEARAWLAAALADAAADTPGPSAGLLAWEAHFAAARRRCGAGAADAVRVLILHAARADEQVATRVYDRGDAAERRAVLRALPHLDLGSGAVPLVEDALRTNDTRLVAAALGPYAAAHLGDHAWRQAVLKCLFTGVPADEIAGLADRAAGDGELARMLTDYARERTAAGRAVPADLDRILALTRKEV